MATLNQIYKCGFAVTATLTSNSVNGAVSRNGLTVGDLASNTAYSCVIASGSSPANAMIVLPPVEGNWCVIFNGCGAAITVGYMYGDANPVTLSANECATVMFSGSLYIKTTASTTTSLDIASYGALSSPSGSDLLLVKDVSLGTHTKMTLDTLKTYLGIVPLTTVGLLEPVEYVLNNVSGTLTGTHTTPDGVTILAGSRVLVLGTDATASGVFVSSVSAWARSTDMPVGASASGCIVSVKRNSGATSGTLYQCTSLKGSDIVNTNTLAWARMLTAQASNSDSTEFGDVVHPAPGSYTATGSFVQSITGNPATGVVTVNGSAPAVYNSYPTSSSSNVLMQAASVDAGPVLWTHGYAGLTLPVRSGSLQVLKSMAVSGGECGFAVDLASVSPTWAVHCGVIEIAIFRPKGAGQDYLWQVPLPYYAVYVAGACRASIVYESRIAWYVTTASYPNASAFTPHIACDATSGKYTISAVGSGLSAFNGEFLDVVVKLNISTIPLGPADVT